jgi:fatty acid desaturase
LTQRRHPACRLFQHAAFFAAGMKIFAHSTKDAIPVLCALAHTGYLILLFAIFPATPWWLLGALGFIYSVSISWNINGIAHNFIHNPYFVWPPLNRAFSWLLSVTVGFSQQFYDLVHHRHHQGNSDRKDANGDTIDWLSIYRHSHDDEAENAWTYTFFGYFRDDPKLIFQRNQTSQLLQCVLGNLRDCFVGLPRDRRIFS